MGGGGWEVEEEGECAHNSIFHITIYLTLIFFFATHLSKKS